jgi:hypothetical protein
MKGNLFQCLIEHHAMKKYEGVEVKIYSFLISALGGWEWSVSRLGRFASCTPWAGVLMVPTAGLDTGEEKRILPVPGIESWHLGHSAPILATIST